MAREDTATEDEMKEFFHQIVDQAQLRLIRRFKTGSVVEVPYLQTILRAYQQDLRNCDVDTMYYYIDCYAFPRGRSVPEAYYGTVLRICTDHMHAGYARLVDDEDGLELLYGQVQSYDDDGGETVTHGPAQLYNPANFFRRSVPKSLNSDEYAIALKLDLNLQDRVFAVHCPFWPAEASEWITRTRRHGCPSKSVIKQVVRYGCDFVGVAHKLSPNRNGTNEWRFSFSRAERIIIGNWTGSQRVVYRTLTVINKIVKQRVNKLPEQEIVLCTYYFKTLMLWACEEQPPEFWTDSSLVESVRHLLIRMCLCLNLRICPNYFIPNNNMMDHLRETNVAEQIWSLRDIHANICFISRMIQDCQVEANAHASTKFHFRLPTWIFTGYKVSNRIDHVFDNFSKLYSRQYSVSLSTALKVELANIYRALCCHKNATSCGIGSPNYKMSLKDAEQHLFRAATMTKSIMFVTVNTRYLSDLIPAFFIKYKDTETKKYSVEHNRCYKQLPVDFCETSDSIYMSTNLSNCPIHSKTKVKNTDLELSSNDGMHQSEKSQIIKMYVTYMNPTDIEEEETYYRDWPGVSPTVNISWFVAKAYLANLFLVTSHDNQATVSTCDDILHVYKQSHQNRVFAEMYLPVLMSTQWTAVYDEEIQAVLGFYSLSAFVRSKGERRSVQLGVCPVQFALYLKLRSALECSLWRNCMELWEKYIDHSKECRTDNMVRNGTQAIHQSLLLKAEAELYLCWIMLGSLFQEQN